MERPHRRYQVTININGDTLDDVIGELQEVTRMISINGDSCNSVSGGYSSSHIVSISIDKEIDGDAYRAKLHRYIKEQKEIGKTPISDLIKEHSEE